MSGLITSTADLGAGMRTCTVPAVRCRLTRQQAKACRQVHAVSSTFQPGIPTGNRTLLLPILQHHQRLRGLDRWASVDIGVSSMRRLKRYVKKFRRPHPGRNERRNVIAVAVIAAAAFLCVYYLPSSPVASPYASSGGESGGLKASA